MLEKGEGFMRGSLQLGHKQSCVYIEEKGVTPVLKKGETDSGRSPFISPVLQQLQMSAL